eukprot:14376896-Ditylum_brightwellii.AAC.1
MLLQGKLHQVVYRITGWDKGRLLQPSDTCFKTDKPVSKVLLSKHPSPSQPSEEVSPEYDAVPAFIDLDVMTDMVEKVATWM